MKGLRLYKAEKLRGDIAVGKLFARAADTQATLCYPLRAVWRRNEVRPRPQLCTRFLASIPKKRIRHAVDRVLMRRRVREAYRLNRSILGDTASLPLDIAFVYIADKPLPYSAVEHALRRILSRIAKSLADNGKADS